MDVLALVLAAALAPTAPAALQESAPSTDPVAPSGREEPAARTLWDAVVAAAVGVRQERVTAFVIDFAATSYSGESQSNDVGATYSYLEPGWVRMKLRSGRERMRGPEGDWLLDKAGAQRLVGRDFKQDKAELDESVAVARTFAHLTDPRGLHLESLASLASPPPGLPPKVRELAGQLDWLRLESRGLRGPPEAGAEKLPPDVLELGVERVTRVPRLAVLTDPQRVENALALAFGLEGARWKDGYVVDGFRVPYSVTAWRIDPTLNPPAFAERQSLDLWFEQGTLAPQLTRADFVPPSASK